MWFDSVYGREFVVQNIQTSSEAQTPSHLLGTWGCLYGVNRLVHTTDH